MRRLSMCLGLLVWAGCEGGDAPRDGAAQDAAQDITQDAAQDITQDAGDAGADASDGAAGDAADVQAIPDVGLGPTEQLLGRAPFFCHDRDVTPDRGEDRFLAAVELPPTTAPIDLVRVVYRTLDTPRSPAPGSVPCLGGAAHQFVLFSATTGRPDADPRVLATLDIAEGTAQGGHRLIDRMLPMAVRYNPGDHIFAAIRYGTFGSTVCIPTCTLEASPTWWSGAAAPPYAWEQLASFGDNFRGHLGVWVVGRAP